MKITKYPHSCLMIESKGKKIVIDPGNIGYEEWFGDEWKKADAILVTHKHSDHVYAEKLKELDLKIYATKEVKEYNPSVDVEFISEGDIFNFGDIKVEVVKAVHGYLPPMKGGKYPKENVGFIVDDGDKRLYHTGDSMCFENDYKADVLCVGVSGHVTMTEYEAALEAKNVEAKLVIPIHMESDKHPVIIDNVIKEFEKQGINYKILKNGESIDI